VVLEVSLSEFILLPTTKIGLALAILVLVVFVPMYFYAKSEKQ
jgi:hypothetical protein